MPKAYSYVRFSSPRQGQGDSVRRQIELARSYAAHNGLELDEELNFHDYGVSAYYGRNARMGALRQFLDRIEAGEIEYGSYLLIENFDRITRDEILGAMGLFLEIINGGITLVTLMDEKKYNKESVNANPTDLLFSLIIMVRAREQSEINSKRLKASWANKASQIKDGLIFHSIVPRWLKINRTENKLEIIKERAEVIKLIFRMALKGKGCLQIARFLNEKGIRSFTGKEYWSHFHVFYLLRNEAVIGRLNLYTRERVGEKKTKRMIEKIENYYPPVIKAAIFNSINTDTITRKMPIRGPGGNIFCRIAKCSACGSVMVRKEGRDSKFYLRCKGSYYHSGCKSNHRIRADRLEKAFVQNLNFIISSAPKSVLSKTTLNDSSKSKLKLLSGLISLHPWEITQINGLLHQLFSAIMINTRTGHIAFHWVQGGKTDILIPRDFYKVPYKYRV